MGLSKARQNHTLSGLALNENLEKRGVWVRGAMQLVGLNSGDVVHELRMEGILDVASACGGGS